MFYRKAVFCKVKSETHRHSLFYSALRARLSSDYKLCQRQIKSDNVREKMHSEKAFGRGLYLF
jgi:hypothetical protein